MHTKEYYIEQLTDLGVDPKTCGLLDGFESCTLDQLQDIFDRAEEADAISTLSMLDALPDEAYDPQDHLENGRFQW